MSTAAKREYLELLEEKIRRRKRRKFYEWFPDEGAFRRELYPKHIEAIALTATKPYVMCFGGNAVGKTELGAFFVTAHVTGEYPWWWPGHKFDRPNWGYAATETWGDVATRCQFKLLGVKPQKSGSGFDGEIGTGMIPGDLIVGVGPRVSSTLAFQYVDVRHVPTGGVSRVEFKTFEQGREGFQGTERDWAWPDEEHKTEGASIFAECVQRFRGRSADGRYFHTMTALNGWTELAAMFVYGMDPKIGRQEYEESGRAWVAISQADVPHISEEERIRKRANAEAHLKDSRSGGMPSMGSGAVYQVEEDFIRVPERQIPPGWKHVWVMDPGYVDPTAVIWAAIDPGTGQIELYSEHYLTRGTPADHASAIKGRDWDWRPFRKPGLIDTSAKRRDGRMTEDGEDATLLRELQDDHGLDVIAVTKTPIAEGCMQVLEALRTGRLKVQDRLKWWFSEYRLYRFDEKNKIVDKNNHLMDCCFTDDTEVLTKAGWFMWKDCPRDSLFATVNLETDALEYQQADEFVDAPWDGEIVALHNKTALRVTPNHRMVVYRRLSKEPTIKRADELDIYDRVKTAAANWSGAESLGLDFDCDDGDLAEFLGWWVAEGSLMHAYPVNPYRFGVIVSQKKPSQVVRLRALLDRMPGAWNYKGVEFQCTNKALYDLLKPLGHSHTKYVPDFIKNASQRLIGRFLDGYLAGDGWLQRNTRSCATVSRRLADDLQELFFKIGRCSSMYVRKAHPYNISGRSGTNTRTQYWVTEHRTTTAMLRDSQNNSNIRREHYAGRIYCAQVANGTLVVRREGRVSVTGNTRYLITGGGMARAKTKPSMMPEPTMRELIF